MAERPLLNLPAPEPFRPRKIVGGGPKIVRPSREQQRARLEPKFARLEAVAADPTQLLSLRADPASIAPERAIVFEVEGSVEDFYRQARDLGLDYLGDFEEEIPPSKEFYNAKARDSSMSGRIYLAMPDVQALQELLSRWRNYKTRKQMPKGQGPWGDLFKRLIDVRPWRPQDRIEEEAVRYWQEELDANPDQPVRLEVEYWYFESDERRARARASVQQMVHELGGVVLDSAQIPEIRYEAALVRLSAVHVRTLIDNQNISLARSDDIMYLRPQTAAVFPAVEELTGVENQNPPAPVDFIAPDPVVALLDGLPIQNHSRLVGRLRVDDQIGRAHV